MKYQRPIRCLLLGFCVCLHLNIVCGQADQGLLHPLTAASGGCRSLARGLPSLFGNPAGLYSRYPTTFMISHQSRFGIRELASSSAGIGFSVHKVQMGALYTRYGFEGFSEQIGGLNSALALTGNMDAGIQIRYYSSRQGEEYASSQRVGFSLGLRYAISESIHLGMLLDNPLVSGENQHTPIPFKAAMGASLELGALSRAYLEAEQESGRKLRMKSGFEYRITPGLRVAIGVNNRPVTWSFGMAFQYRETNLHMSFVYHQILGWSPSIALQYKK